ncbi:hypothetical protein POVCU2_0086660 [Plasmodium ovale curtisi]|uniref:Uncharacterized protein n=1 Tax=Plasmodium ovale curtisi TaxID=864141 RepID=A0A1A8XG21_PLAOA|nr:hypothetical protein POVCU2_0086660 [Plasmodium ovale curtisi]SBT02874.1 hypothetical protein POVCU1_081690 [Plasmodium ovale curtisi]
MITLRNIHILYSYFKIAQLRLLLSIKIENTTNGENDKSNSFEPRRNGDYRSITGKLQGERKDIMEQGIKERCEEGPTRQVEKYGTNDKVREKIIRNNLELLDVIIRKTWNVYPQVASGPKETIHHATKGY